MDSHILTHTISLQDTLNSLRQEILTELFLELNLEKDCLKHKLIKELDSHKESILIELRNIHPQPMDHTTASPQPYTSLPIETIHNFNTWMNRTNVTTDPNSTGTNTDAADGATTSNTTQGPNTSTPQPTTFMG